MTQPLSLKLNFAPVSFLDLGHRHHVFCRVDNGTLLIRNGAGESAWSLSADARSGRLIRFELGTTGKLRIRSEEGAFAGVVNELTAATSKFSESFDPNRPWSSSITFLASDLGFLLKRLPPELEPLAKLALEQMLHALAGLEEVPWARLLESLENVQPPPHDDAQEFPLLLEGPPTEQVIKLIAALVLRNSDKLWPRGSWSWGILREGLFLAGGQPSNETTSLMPELTDQDIGPLGCLLAGHLFNRLRSPMARAYAKHGADRANPEAFQEDLPGLLRGDQLGPKLLRSLLGSSRLWQREDSDFLEAVLGASSANLLREAHEALEGSPTAEPEGALQPVLERHWHTLIRPTLLTELAMLCLTSPQGFAPLDVQSAAEAAGWLSEAADEDHPKAQLALGRLYRDGVGLPRDPAMGAIYFRKAADQKYPHAACELARLYRSGAGIPQNLDEAARWFGYEADRGCTSAMVGLAEVLLTRSAPGGGDRNEAIRWLHKAADLDVPEAQILLASVLERDGEVRTALGLYRQAAEKGLVQAQVALAERLSDGFTTATDYPEAWIWFMRAAFQGYQMAELDAQRLQRKLTAEQLESARRRLESSR